MYQIDDEGNSRERKLSFHWFADDMIRDTTTDIFYLHGGVGSAKSFGAVQKQCAWILDNPKCPDSWWILPTHAKVKDAGIPKWLEWFDCLGWREGRHYKVLSSPPCRIIIRNGIHVHTLWFQSADKPQLMVANQIGFFTVSEAGQISYEVLERATTRRRDRRARYLQTIIEGQPEGMTWFADLADYDGYNAERNEKSYELWTEDNAHNLAPGYIEACLKAFGHNKAKVDSWLFGKFRNFFEGAAYKNFQDEDVTDRAPVIGQELYLTWDNNAPLAWVAGQIHKDERGIDLLYWHEESSGKDHLLTDACQDFVAKFDPLNGWRDTPIVIDGDAALWSPSVRASGSGYDEIFTELRKYYTNVRVIAARANPLQTVRVEDVNRGFSYGRVKVSTKCQKVIRSLNRVTWKADFSRELLKSRAEDVNAYSDAIGYFITKWIKLNLNIVNKITKRNF